MTLDDDMRAAVEEAAAMRRERTLRRLEADRARRQTRPHRTGGPAMATRKASKHKLSPADRKRLKELRSWRRHVNSSDYYHPALWYGVEPEEAIRGLVAEALAGIDAEIAELTAPPVPVLTGKVIPPGAPRQDVLW